MNIDKTVRKALFSDPKKVELSAEKVELKDLSTLKAWIKKHESAIAKLKAFKKEKEKMQQEAEMARSDSFKEAQTVVRAAESFGLKGKDIPEVVELFRISKEVLDLARGL
jgi:DNA repair photolyase